MEKKKENGMSVKTRRVVAYVVLVLITILCLFWFYVLFINATRSNSELKRGFTMIPSKYLGQNLHNIFHSSNLPILTGLFNSFFIAFACFILPEPMNINQFFKLVQFLTMKHSL